MLKLCSVLLALVLLGCNTNNSSGAKKDTTQATAVTEVPSNWSKEDEQEFINSCMENAKASASDTVAYAYCKCMLEKVQQRFPTLDSTVTVLQDSTEAAKIAEGCKGITKK
jgi:hypothetical protein